MNPNFCKVELKWSARCCGKTSQSWRILGLLGRSTVSQTLNHCKREITLCEPAPSIIFDTAFQGQLISGAIVLGLLGIYNAETRIRSSSRTYVSLFMRHGLRTSPRITAAFLGFYEWLRVSVVVWSIQIYKLSVMVAKIHSGVAHVLQSFKLTNG